MAISLIFWLLVKLSGTYDTSREIFLKVELPETRAFSSGQPPPVKVDLQGTGWDLLIGIFRARDTLRYDLTQMEPEQFNANRLRSDINARYASSDLQVQEIYDNDIDLNLEETLSRRLPIRLRDSLSFTPGYKLQRPVQLRPDSVLVIGPESKVRELTEWPTRPFRVSRLRTSRQYDVILEPPPPSIRLGTRTVHAEITVEQMTEESLFVRLQVVNDPGTDSLRFFPQLIRVKYIVGLSDYAQVDSSDFRLVADLENTQVVEGRNTVPLSLAEKPDVVRNVTFSPQTVQYFVVKPDSLSQETPRDSIQ